METIGQFILENVEIIILVTVFVLVEIVKAMLWTKLENFKQYIPAFAGLAGVFLYAWSQDWALTFRTFYVGLISGWAATGGFETIKNLWHKE